MYIQPQNGTDPNFPTRLDTLYLLDSGASTSVTKIPTYMMIIRMFKVCNQYRIDASETLVIANQSELSF